MIENVSFRVVGEIAVASWTNKSTLGTNVDPNAPTAAAGRIHPGERAVVWCVRDAGLLERGIAEDLDRYWRSYDVFRELDASSDIRPEQLGPFTKKEVHDAQA